MDESVTDQINNENCDECGERFSDSQTDITLMTECENLTEIVGKVEDDGQPTSGCKASFVMDTNLTKLPKYHECLGSVETCPQLKSILPSGYDYVVCNLLPFEAFDGEDRFSTIFRIAMGRAEEAEQWLYEFQSSSKTTWRVDKTYPDPQLKVIFKKDYHCQHNTRSTSHKGRNIKNSHKKNTNCPAKMTITIKKFAKKTKSEDPHAKTHATLVSLKQTHNHRVMIAEALRHRPVSDDVRLQFIELFKSGMTPPQALSRHQMALKDYYGDRYNEIVVDRFLCPDIHWCYRLYYKLYKTKNGIGSELQEDTVITETRASEAEAALRRLTDSICRKLRQKPKIFVPVVEKLLVISQSLIDDTDDEKKGARPLPLRDFPETKEVHRTKRDLRLCPRESVPRKRGRPAKLTHTKEHDYSSVRPAEDNSLGTDSKAFAQSILIPASYSSGVVLSGDMNLNALPESWGIMFGTQCDLPAHVTHFETSPQEGVVTALVTSQDLNDSVAKETMLDVSMQYNADQSSAQTYHFISEDNAHVNIVHVNSNQGNDVVGNGVPDLKEFLRCF